MLFLTEPQTQYKESFLEALQEFQQEGVFLQYNRNYLMSNFDSFVEQMRKTAFAPHSSLPPNYVPYTSYWLIEGDEQSGVYVGTLTVRHELNAFLLKVAGHIGYQIRPSWRRKGYGRQILQLGLRKALALGITRALVTCDETNIGSKKVIEYNGGQFENAVYIEGSPVKKLRYWIDIA
ncbi:GNAT family N-acetyltransferase [Dictyobacter arantiisoli]|uniref:Acetyltransferase n=1 Tax=Dictyobacter arantiisoli TaxID=2014874 RepID=A0A5A5T8K8_9CHLR|nr:GNAT family N-acetyltransferase [Dictyobacter arantiisoli]GCF07811.1 acetyltransferase [Dictyobacter arantiisoli]